MEKSPTGCDIQCLPERVQMMLDVGHTLGIDTDSGTGDGLSRDGGKGTVCEGDNSSLGVVSSKGGQVNVANKGQKLISLQKRASTENGGCQPGGIVLLLSSHIGLFCWQFLRSRSSLLPGIVVFVTVTVNNG